LEELFKSSSIVEIVGDSTEGKTEIALQYAKQHKRLYYHKWFVKGEKWREDYEFLAKTWNLFPGHPINEIDPKTLANEVHKAFGQKRPLGFLRSLIIFDNWSQNCPSIEGIDNTDILITSKEIQEIGQGQKIQLNDKNFRLTDQEVLDLLNKLFKDVNKLTTEEKETIIKEMKSPSPLLVVLIGRLFSTTKITIKDCIFQFDTKGWNIKTAVDLNLGEIKNESPNVYKLILYCSLLPGRGIPKKLMDKLVQVQPEEEKYLKRLVRYECDVFTMNEAIQGIVATTAPKKKYLSDIASALSQLPLNEAKAICVQGVKETKIKEGNRESWLVYVDGLATYDSFRRETESPRLVDYSKESVSSGKKNWSRSVPHSAPIIIQDPEILKYQLEAFDMWKVSEDSSIKANRYDDMSSTYWKMGKYKEALQSKKDALEIRKKIKDTIAQAKSLEGIGSLLWEMGKYDEALQSKVDALQIRETNNGEKLPMAIICNNIASMCMELGKYDEALKYETKAMQINKEVLTQNHPDVQINNKNISLIKKYMGVEKSSLSANRLLRRMQTSPSLGTPNSKHSDKTTIEKVDEGDKALKYPKNELSVPGSDWRSEHLLATRQNNLSLVSWANEKKEEAFKYQIEALKHKTLEREQPEPDLMEQSVARRCFEAEEKKLSALQGKNNLEEAIIHENLGLIYSAMGEYEKSAYEHNCALRIIEQEFKDTPILAVIYDNTGLAYWAIGEHKEALEYEEKALKVMQNYESDSDVEAVIKLLSARVNDLKSSKTPRRARQRRVVVRGDELD
jgi:tetratricopeptide (TPR) repeat protein